MLAALILGLGAVSGHGQMQMSGRLGLDLIARRIPTTLTGEIKLDTPSEYVMLEFAVASRLVLNIPLGFADLNVDAAVNTAGPEHLVLKGNLALGEVDIYDVILEGVSVVPELWWAVPFEAVTDVNGLPNSVIIPPADILFVSARFPFSASLCGFTLRHLAMLEDVNFPNPGASHEPLYYPVQSQSFAVGSLTTVSWRAQIGVSVSASLGINAAQAGKSIKGYSASGRVLPDNYFARFAVSGIRLADISLYGTSLQSVVLGTSFAFTKPPSGVETSRFSTTVSLSGRLWDKASVSGSLTLAPFPAKFEGVTVSFTMEPFRFAFALDTMELESMSLSIGSGLNLGSITGRFSVSATGLERGMTGLSMRLSLSQGIFSAGTSVSFTQRAEAFGFASLGSTLTFRFSPAVVTVQATFGRYGLTRAAVTTGVVF